MRARFPKPPAATRAGAAGLALASGLLAATPARAVQVTCGSGSGVAGQTVEITLTTGDLTGLAVTSLQFELTYNATIVTAVGVSQAGTLTQIWNNPTFHVTSGKVAVSHAGTTPLSGSGALIKVQFLVNPAQLAATSTALGLPAASFVFNEGTPSVTTTGGTLNVNATPVIAVSPNSGEVIRGQTLAFSVSGNVTNPVSWFTTDPAIATISGAGLLTGVAPGAVRVYAVDAAGRRDTTDGEVQVRGMGITAGTASVVQGLAVGVPITVTSLSGLGVRAGQFTFTYNASIVTPTGVSAPAGTLLHDWGPIAFGHGAGTCTVDFVGSSDLSGAGTLCTIAFETSAQTSGFVPLTFTQALFNESLAAKTTNGSINVTALPSITVSPDQVTLLAGQTQAFTLTGSPTPPIAWSTLDSSVATINGVGLLTGVAGGVTRVRAVDAVGATDLNTAVTVYDFRAYLPTVVAPPGATVRIPLLADRDIGALGVRSLQYRLTYSAASVLSAEAKPSGLVSLWGEDGVVQNGTPGALQVATAGSAPLGNGPLREIQVLEFVLSPSVSVGTNLPLTLSDLVFNEGRPAAQSGNGTIQVRSAVDVPVSGDVAFTLHPCEPNPMSAGTRFRWAIPPGAHAGDRARLGLYALDGRRVLSLWEGPAAPGEQAILWDGRDQAGVPLGAGLYFYRLEWGARAVSRKLAVLR